MDPVKPTKKRMNERQLLKGLEKALRRRKVITLKFLLQEPILLLATLFTFPERPSLSPTLP